MCPTSNGIEDAEHFLLQCPSFVAQRQDILAKVTDLLRPYTNLFDLSNAALVQLVLYGDNDLPNDVNRTILELNLHFVSEPGRFG